MILTPRAPTAGAPRVLPVATTPNAAPVPRAPILLAIVASVAIAAASLMGGGAVNLLGAAFRHGASISLSPSSARPGASVQVTGSGLPAKGSFQIALDGSPEGMPSVDTTGAGTFRTTLVVPAETAGVHVVSVDGTTSSGGAAALSSTDLASADLTVTEAPDASADSAGPSASDGVGSGDSSSPAASDGAPSFEPGATAGASEPGQSSNPTDGPTPEPSNPFGTPGPTTGPTPGPTPAPTPGPTPAPTPGPTPAPTPEPTPRPTPAPTPTPTPTPKPTPTPTPKPTPTPTPKPTPTPTPAPTSTPPTYTFDDEFSGSSLSSEWQRHFHCCGTVAGYDPSLTSVANGDLEMSVAHRSTGWYTDLIDTKTTFTQKYGYFEARIKIPKGTGLWPAFWNYYSSSTTVAEIDTMEVCANPIGTNGGNDASLLHTTIHWTGGGSLGHAYRSVDLSQAFHVYAVDWRSSYIKFYLDGNLVWTFTDTAHIPNVAEPLILNLGVGGSWCGAPDSSTPSNATMLVDWVRVRP